MMQAKQIRSSFIILTVMICTIAGCANPPIAATSFSPEKIMADAYGKVTLTDGIDEKEAFTLAAAYFHAYLPGCGAVGETIDRDNKWEVKTAVGYAATPYSSIFVEKKTGTITCTNGPTIKPPVNFNL